MSDAGGAAAPQKRPRLEGEGGEATPGAAPSAFREGLLSEASEAALRRAYAGGRPYPHCLIPDAFDPALLRAAREEVINNLQATYKETDLFKMFQTGDLANMDRLDPEAASKLPSLLALRDALYSPPFRSFVSSVTGCGELERTPDCACNVHAAGGHLLCHDDVIGNRRVSYIIYLTDPDDPWTAADGGALELYPPAADDPTAPDTTPAAAVVPAWNALAMFTVVPGQSFHSIQEVLTGDKPRMSIQGWFHADAPPPGAEAATLRQLQARAGADGEGGFEGFAGEDPTGDELSEADLALLGRYISPAYLAPGAWPKVQARFAEAGSIQLHNFLAAPWAQRLAAATAAADAADGVGRGAMPPHGLGVGGGWAAVGPSHKQRYLQYRGDAGGAGEAAAPGALLAELRAALFASAAFARLLKKFTTIGLLAQRAEVRRFRPGLDYTVAHYGVLTGRDPRLDAVLCFVADSEGAGDREAWEGGEVGGYEAYLLADEEGEAAEEVYRKAGDDESGVLNVSPASNSLSLVLRDQGLMRFVKYLSARAPGSRWDLAAVYEPEPDSDSGSEGEGEGASSGAGGS